MPGHGRARGPVASEVGEQPPDGRGIALGHAAVPRAIAEKTIEDRLTQIGDTESTAGHPPSEASENADPDAESLVGVSETSEVFEEGVHV